MIQFLHHIFVRDWPLKLFSLALAVLTWLAVSFSLRREVVEVAGPTSTAERTFYDLPVIVMSTAADVHDFKVEPRQVDVTVQGDPKILHDLKGQQIHVIANLTDIESSTDLRERIEVYTPSGVTHVRVQPEEVNIIQPPHPTSTNTSDQAPTKNP
jgi:YbbR domain-containing protein